MPTNQAVSFGRSPKKHGGGISPAAIVLSCFDGLKSVLIHENR
jgi:hypothetical protein